MVAIRFGGANKRVPRAALDEVLAAEAQPPERGIISGEPLKRQGPGVLDYLRKLAESGEIVVRAWGEAEQQAEQQRAEQAIRFGMGAGNPIVGF